MRMQILCGDALEILRTLPDASVHCCITSPPYYGLRDYGTAKWEGGDAACDHALPKDAPNSSKMTAGQQTSHAGRFSGDCRKCGARRIDAQLGLERTPEEYVSKLVAVFQEVKRVLRDDGTLWLNLGDSYWGGKGSNGSSKARRTADERGYTQSGGTVLMDTRPTDGMHAVIKPKDLIGIPWRVAFALQADGWYLRQDIIWAKPNPMPESVRDRCTKAHEYVFMLSKSGNTNLWRARDTMEWSWNPDLSQRLPRPTKDEPDATVSRWIGFNYYYDAEAISEPSIHANEVVMNRRGINNRLGGTYGQTRQGFFKAEGVLVAETRNKRSVWTTPVRPLGGGVHFAVFPPELITPMVLAGCPEGGTVLDPFAGSGTTGMVAENLGRNSVLIELNPKYIELIKKRTRQCGT
jgi:DNA modification methylase